MSAPAESDWIDWAGGECPVAGDVLVESKADDGRIVNATPASDLPWNSWISAGYASVGDGCDIIAYRVVSL